MRPYNATNVDNQSTPQLNSVVTTAPLTLGSMLKALRYHWFLSFFVIPGMAAGIGSAIWFLIPPPKQVAATTFHVHANAPKVLFNMDESGFSNYRTAQGKLIKSRSVITTVLSKPEIHDLVLIRDQVDPLDWLENNLGVDWPYGAEYLRISLEGPGNEKMARAAEADELKSILQAVSKVYLDSVVNKDSTSRNLTLLKLQDINKRYGERLEKNRQLVRELSENVGSNDEKVIAFKQQFAQEQLAQSQRELMQIRTEIRRTELELKAKGIIQSKSKDPEIPEQLIQEEVTLDPTVQKASQAVSRYEGLISEFKKRAQPGIQHPTLTRYESELQKAKSDYESLIKELRPQVVTRVKDRFEQSQAASANALKDKLEYAKTLDAALSQEIDAMVQGTKQLNTNRLDIEKYTREIADADMIAKQLSTKVEALQLEKEAPSRVSVFEEPSINTRAEGKKKLKFTLMGTVGPLALCLFGIIFWEHRAKRITTLDELTKITDLKLVGTVPDVHKRGSMVPWKTALDRQIQEKLTEAIDSTRTVVCHESKNADIRVVMITSAFTGEGKTSLSCHLGLSFARAGLKTLIIDGDMRRPSTHKVLQIKTTVGLSEVLRSEMDVEDVIEPTPFPGLDLLPAGHWTAQATQKLAGKEWSDLLHTLRGQYDFIIVDSPPLLPVVDSLLLCQAVDAVLLSVLKNSSQVGAFHDARHKLNKVGIEPIGVVMNGVEGGLYTSSQYYYYSQKVTAKA
jgi:polysaccharide biosynthesis transport protein